MSAYETDIVTWANEQGQAFRARSVDALDWDNLAEEIETVGRAETTAVTEPLIAAVVAKLTGRSAAPALVRAAKRYRPSMPISVQDDVHEVAVLDALVDRPGAVVPLECPWSLEELLAEGAAARKRQDDSR